MSKDPMEGGEEFKPLKFKLGKPGDILKGTMISKNTYNPPGGDPYTEIEVKVDICEFHDLKADEAGNYVAVEPKITVDKGEVIKYYGGRRDVDTLLNGSNVGDIVGFRFEKFEKGKGPKPYKVVLCKNFGKDDSFAEPQIVDSATVPGVDF